MSKHLSELLSHPEKEITKAIAALEEKNGYPSHDVRLSAENIQQVRQKIADLGLDPDDTTAEELYHSLLIKFQADAKRFDVHFGVSGQPFDDKIQKAAALVSANVSLPERWVLRSSAAKMLLRQHPPKRLMKQLHYRSVESLLKREDLAELYLGVELIESQNWNKAHFRLASKLDSAAFERRPLKLAALTARKWGWQGDKKLYLASSDYGVLGLSPDLRLEDASLISLVVMLLEELGAKPSEAARFSPAAAWWADTDRVLAKYQSGPVSFNLHDLALSLMDGAESDEHAGKSAKRHFWKELVGRYQNGLNAAEDNSLSFGAPVLKLEPAMDQPAFEYVEDL